MTLAVLAPGEEAAPMPSMEGRIADVASWGSRKKKRDDVVYYRVLKERPRYACAAKSSYSWLDVNPF